MRKESERESRMMSDEMSSSLPPGARKFNLNGIQLKFCLNFHSCSYSCEVIAVKFARLNPKKNSIQKQNSNGNF